MKSDSYQKQGEGVPPAPEVEIVAGTSTTDDERPHCSHVDRQGRHCRQLPAPGADLCGHHARALLIEHLHPDPVISKATADKLLDGMGDFSSPVEVRRFLRNVVRQVVRQRVGRRDAITLAYLCQLILNCQGLTIREVREAQRREAAEPLDIIWDLPGPPKDPAPDA